MPNYRRFRVPGGTWFFTLALQDRRSDLLTRHIDALRIAVCETRRRRRFIINAWVVLPDHMHCVITLPRGDCDFSNRIKAMKIRFVRQIAATERRSPEQTARRERNVWQRRFWEHAIRDRDDFARHADYVHFNPVKHGYVLSASHWPWSTFNQWVEAGVYPRDWASDGSAEIGAGEHPSHPRRPNPS